jgi:hypothetical protein
MVLSCRHCYCQDENLPVTEGLETSHQGVAGKGAPSSSSSSYASFFVHGSEETLLRAMQWVESHRPLPGISIWWVTCLHNLDFEKKKGATDQVTFQCRCERCCNVSIVSYKLYKHLWLQEDCMKEAEVIGRHEYYSRMCISAERLIMFQKSQQQNHVKD